MLALLQTQGEWALIVDLDKTVAILQIVSGSVGFLISIGCLIALVRLLRRAK